MPNEPDETVAEQSAEAPGGDAAPVKAKPVDAKPDEARPDDSAKKAMENISSLDEQFAAFADDLIAGDLEDSDGSVMESATGVQDNPSTDEIDSLGEDAAEEPGVSEMEAGKSEHLSEAGGSKDANGDATDRAGEPSEAASEEGEVSATGEGEVDSTASGADTAEPPAPAGKTAVAASTDAAGASRAARLNAMLGPIANRAKPVLFAAVRTLSSPLASKPAIVRRIVGLLAIWTTLLAVVMALMVLTRTAEAPTTSQAPVELHGAAPVRSADGSD